MSPRRPGYRAPYLITSLLYTRPGSIDRVAEPAPEGRIDQLQRELRERESLLWSLCEILGNILHEQHNGIVLLACTLSTLHHELADAVKTREEWLTSAETALDHLAYINRLQYDLIYSFSERPRLQALGDCLRGELSNPGVRVKFAGGADAFSVPVALRLVIGELLSFLTGSDPRPRRSRGRSEGAGRASRPVRIEAVVESGRLILTIAGAFVPEFKEIADANLAEPSGSRRGTDRHLYLVNALMEIWGGHFEALIAGGRDQRVRLSIPAQFRAVGAP